MPDQPGEGSPPKIIIDSDWKAQAQKEREKLAAKEKEDAAKKAQLGASRAGDPAGATATAGKGGASAGGGEALPAADFQALIGTLATQALMYLGAFPDPQTGRAMVSLEYARFNIDLLGVLDEKCKGNLTKEEGDDLKQALTELRLRFVEIAKAIAQASKDGRMRPTGNAGEMGMIGGPGAMGAMGGPAGISGPGF